MNLAYKSVLAFFSALTLTAGSALACPDFGGLADLNCDGQVRILCMGDSITAGENDSSRLGYPGRLESIILPGTNVRNIGIGGEDTGRGRERINRFFSNPANREFEYVIVLEGVNDYFVANHSASNTRSNLFTMIRTASNAGAITMLGSLTAIKRVTSQKGWVDSVNSQIRSNVRIDFFSLGTGIISSDKLHPNDAGYQRMGELAASILRAYSEANRPADTDHDGIYDFAEARFGVSPASADADGDGLLDGQEVFTFNTNPLVGDSDGDGVSDQVEAVVRGTNPLSPLPVAPTINSLQAIP